MIIPHEFLVWHLDAPVICIGADFEMDTVESVSSLSGSFICIDESYAPDRRRSDIF
jgi:hypothetical protein